MDITNISAIQSLSDVSRYTDSTAKVTGSGEENRFDSFLSSAINMIGETNQLSNADGCSAESQYFSAVHRCRKKYSIGSISDFDEYADVIDRHL